MKRLDRIVRRWALLAGLMLFAAGSSTVWVTSTRAQSGIENAIRLSEMESWRKEQAEVSRGQGAELATHDRKISVMETIMIEQTKRLDAIEGYGKWLVLGMFSLFGAAIWEKIIPRGKDDSGGFPLVRRAKN